MTVFVVVKYLVKNVVNVLRELVFVLDTFVKYFCLLLTLLRVFNMALKKVKGNLERMFDKNLTDLVRGIRNNKDNEVSLYI